MKQKKKLFIMLYFYSRKTLNNNISHRGRYYSFQNFF